MFSNYNATDVPAGAIEFVNHPEFPNEGNSIKRYELKLGREIVQLMNFCIEEQARRKAFLGNMPTIEGTNVSIKGTRYLIMTGFRDELEQVGVNVNDAIFSQLFANNGSVAVIRTYLPKTWVEDILQRIVSAMIAYACSDEEFAQEVITNRRFKFIDDGVITGMKLSDRANELIDELFGLELDHDEDNEDDDYGNTAEHEDITHNQPTAPIIF